MAEHGVRAGDVRKIVVQMPDDRLPIVDNREIPDICLQHLLALTLADGALTFASAHDYARMADPAVLAVRRRIEVVPSAELTAAVPARQASSKSRRRMGNGCTIAPMLCAARPTIPWRRPRSRRRPSIS
jgi:2-methylcitrate dehydratase PrpD